MAVFVNHNANLPSNRFVLHHCQCFGRNSTKWFGFAWFGFAWFGFAWFGFAWFGFAWFGFAWFGFALKTVTNDRF
jgi:hypothetical protein